MGMSSSLTNINEACEEDKPKVVIKSLDDIKNRLNEIRARKRQVKMGELTQHKWMSMDEGLAVASDPNNGIVAENGNTNSASLPIASNNNSHHSQQSETLPKPLEQQLPKETGKDEGKDHVPLYIRMELPKLITERRVEEELEEKLEEEEKEAEKELHTEKEEKDDIKHCLEDIL